MYSSYFGLNEPPFSIAPDPLYLYMSERHREAFAHLQYGIRSNGGFVVLTGDVGTGKTTLCRKLLEEIPADVDVAYILNPRLAVSELLETVCDELGIVYPQQASNKQLIDGLNTRLLETHAQGRKTVLIIDEAQQLSLDVLEQLRLLTNLETSRHKLLQIVLLGQPELRHVLDRADMRQLAQRITARCHLGPLEENEVGDYVRHRLQIAGCSSALFPANVTRSLWKMTGGVPRLINLVCDRALLGAYAHELDTVDRGVLDKAGREILGKESRATRGMMAAAVLIGLLVVLMVVSANWYWKDTNPPAETTRARMEQTLSSSLPDKLTPARPEAIPASNSGADKPAEFWPTDFAAGFGREDAYASLARLWKLEYPPERQDFCSVAAAHGLQCLARRDSLETLLGFDLPAILTLYDDEGIPFHVVMEEQAGDVAVFSAGQDRRRLAMTAIDARWFGEYLLLWAPQFPQNVVIEPGGSGAAVSWLADALDELGLYRRAQTTDRLEGVLLSALKRFQTQVGLTPDGVLGPMTQIHLNRALGLHPLRLKTREAG